jgi:hypothetical protein
MKKITFLLFALCASVSAFAQDTLLWENFENDPSGYIIATVPTNIPNETMWINFDNDGLNDASGTNRAPEWFWSAGFSNADSSTGVYASNGWTNNSTTPVQNWLITPSIPIIDNTAMLSWKSAPYQTPLYLDGYVVLVSTTTNLETDFHDTLFKAAEYVSHNVPSDSSFSSYTFSPANAFVHGQDGQYTEYIDDSLRLNGVLRPFTASLSAYEGGHVYIAFVHNSHDDNLLSVDDILITGTDPTSVREFNNDIAMNVYPNPSSGITNISYILTKESPVLIDIYNINGKLVRTESKGLQAPGEYTSAFSTEGLAHGYYNIVVRTTGGNTAKRLMVK